MSKSKQKPHYLDEFEAEERQDKKQKFNERRKQRKFKQSQRESSLVDPARSLLKTASGFDSR